MAAVPRYLFQLLILQPGHRLWERESFRMTACISELSAHPSNVVASYEGPGLVVKHSPSDRLLLATQSVLLCS